MSTNCIVCVKNKRTGGDLLCDECRAVKATQATLPQGVWPDAYAPKEELDQALLVLTGLVNNESIATQYAMLDIENCDADDTRFAMCYEAARQVLSHHGIEVKDPFVQPS